MLSLFKFFSWLGGGRVCDGRGTVDMLECAFDGGEVSLFHGVYDLDGPFGGIARYVYAHLRPYVGFIVERTAAVPNHGERSLHNENLHSRKSKCSASFSELVVLAVALTWLLRSSRGRSLFPAVFAGDPRFVDVPDDSDQPAYGPFDVARSRLMRARRRDARERPSTSFMSTLVLHVWIEGQHTSGHWRRRP